MAGCALHAALRNGTTAGGTARRHSSARRSPRVRKSRYTFIYTYTGQRPSMLVVAIGIVLGSTTARILLGGPRGPGSKAWMKRCDYHKSRGDPVALSSGWSRQRGVGGAQPIIPEWCAIDAQDDSASIGRVWAGAGYTQSRSI